MMGPVASSLPQAGDPHPPPSMSDRRLHHSLRTHFDALQADLLRRLEPSTQGWTAAERAALAAEITRRRVRSDYRRLLQAPPRAGPAGTSSAG